MASVYKPAGSKKYRIAYVNARGERKTTWGYRDKQASLARAHQLERDAERARAGMSVVSPEAKAKPVSEAVEAYLAELSRIGSSEDHVGNERGNLRRLIKNCNWKTVGDIRTDDLSKWLAKLDQEGRSKRTQNAYRDSAVALGNFAVRQKWLPENPLLSVPKARLPRKGPRQRRALTVVEFRKLIRVHPKRSLVYQLAGLSGLRRRELRLLEGCDFKLGEKPLWQLRPEITKGKRQDKVPMLPECADLLAAMQIEPRQKVFRSVPIPRTFNNDLERAGIAKLDIEGRQADFHGLRYFFCTLTGKVLPIQVVKVLMRHRDIRTTCNLYMDLGLDDISEQLPSLPRLLSGTGLDHQ